MAKAYPECSEDCRWPFGQGCLSFSTDGTRLGAQIAHSMGTTDERAIVDMAKGEFFTDIAAEQADWEQGLNEDG